MGSVAFLHRLNRKSLHNIICLHEISLFIVKQSCIVQSVRLLSGRFCSAEQRCLYFKDMHADAMRVELWNYGVSVVINYFLVLYVVLSAFECNELTAASFQPILQGPACPTHANITCCRQLWTSLNFRVWTKFVTSQIHTIFKRYHSTHK